MNNPKRNPTSGPMHPRAVDPLLTLLRSTGRSITYRPILRQLTGDINAAILLQQIAFHYVTMRRNTFYKFVEPSEHDHRCYKVGDSWTEELGFTKDEYEHAIKRIGTKVKRSQAETVLSDITPRFGPSDDRRSNGKGRLILLNRNHLVVYWREPDNMLRFHLNDKLLVSAIQVLQHQAEVENPPQRAADYSLQDTDSALKEGQIPPSLSIEDAIEKNRENAREVTKAKDITAPGQPRRKTNDTSDVIDILFGDNDYDTGKGQRANHHTETDDHSDLEVIPEETPDLYSDLEQFIVETFDLDTGLNPHQRRRLRKPVTWTPDDSDEKLVGASPNELWDTDPLFEEWINDNLVTFLAERDMMTVGNFMKQITSGKQYTNFYRWHDWRDDEVEYGY